MPDALSDLHKINIASKTDGLLTEREEFPSKLSGVGFVGAILKVPEKPNFGYRRGIYAAFLNGYVVSFEVQARDEERIKQVLSTTIKVAPSANP